MDIEISGKVKMKQNLYEYLQNYSHLKAIDDSLPFSEEFLEYKKFVDHALQTLASKQLPFWRKSFSKKYDTLKFCLSKYRPSEDDLIMEFGVWQGGSISQIAKLCKNHKVYGFDSFLGFPKDGRKDWKKNFSLNGASPNVPKNVELIKGYFQDTLPDFMELHKDRKIGFLHIDCNLYSSTKTIFEYCGNNLKDGCVIVFDNMLHYHDFLQNELLAFYEYQQSSGKKFHWIATRGKVMQLDDFFKNVRGMSRKLRHWRELGYEQSAALILTAPN